MSKKNLKIAMKVAGNKIVAVSYDKTFKILF